MTLSDSASTTEGNVVPPELTLQRTLNCLAIAVRSGPGEWGSIELWSRDVS